MTAERTGRTRRGIVAVMCAGLLASVVGVLMLPRWTPAASSTNMVAWYPMNEEPGATVMHNASALGPELDGVLGDPSLNPQTIIDTGVELDAWPGPGVGYYWSDPPNGEKNSPRDPRRIIRVDGGSMADYLNPDDKDFAVEIRMSANPSHWGNLVQKGQGATLGGFWKLELYGWQPNCVFRDATGLSVDVRAETALPPHEIQVVRCEFDADHGSGGELRILVDGVVEKREKHHLGPIANNWPVAIGGKWSCNGGDPVQCDYYGGWMDEVKIFKGVDLPGSTTTSTTTSTTAPTTGSTTTTTSVSQDPPPPPGELGPAEVGVTARRGQRWVVP